MWSADDLIVAPATPAGPGARAIVRLAGDGLEPLLGRLFDVGDPRGLPARGAAPRVVTARLAGGLGRAWGALAVEILVWPGPGGPVGGPLAEVQLPGSAPLVDAVVAAACDHGARLARGGEFTLRGFLSGRLDLLQAEAVLGLVDARTPAELSAALDRMAGGAGATLRGLRSGLLDLLADVEAALDFADETTPDAVPVADAPARRALAARLAQIRADLDAVARDLVRRDAGAGTDLPRAVLVGRPNIGKSSLFNALVGRDAALVADEAGTTRDWLEAPLAGAGVACVIVDMAGIAADPERAGSPQAAAAAAAREQVERADVVVACRDAEDVACTFAPAAGRQRVEVVTRCDRGAVPPTGVAILTSARDGRGVDALRVAIRAAVTAAPARTTPATLRMAVGVAECATALAAAAACGAADAAADEAVAAGHLRRAVVALDEITGATIGTDLLDRIFSRHCVGK